MNSLQLQESSAAVTTGRHVLLSEGEGSCDVMEAVGREVVRQYLGTLRDLRLEPLLTELRILNNKTEVGWSVGGWVGWYWTTKRRWVGLLVAGAADIEQQNGGGLVSWWLGRLILNNKTEVGWSFGGWGGWYWTTKRRWVGLLVAGSADIEQQNGGWLVSWWLGRLILNNKTEVGWSFGGWVGWYWTTKRRWVGQLVAGSADIEQQNGGGLVFWWLGRLILNNKTEVGWSVGGWVGWYWTTKRRWVGQLVAGSADIEQQNGGWLVSWWVGRLILNNKTEVGWSVGGWVGWYWTTKRRWVGLLVGGSADTEQQNGGWSVGWWAGCLTSQQPNGS